MNIKPLYLQVIVTTGTIMLTIYLNTSNNRVIDFFQLPSSFLCIILLVFQYYKVNVLRNSRIHIIIRDLGTLFLCLPFLLLIGTGVVQDVLLVISILCITMPYAVLTMMRRSLRIRAILVRSRIRKKSCWNCGYPISDLPEIAICPECGEVDCAYLQFTDYYNF